MHTATRADAWSDWSRRAGIGLSPTREIYLEHFYQTLQAAVSGTGIAIGPAMLVADDLQSGALAAPWGFIEDSTEYALLRSKRAGKSHAFETILDWLRTEAQTVRSIAMPQS